MHDTFYAFGRPVDGALADYPTFEGDLRILVGNVSLLIPLTEAPDGWVGVADVVPPEFDPMTQELCEGDPEETPEGWRRTWQVTQLGEDAIAEILRRAAERLRKNMEGEVQRHLDAAAAARGYGDDRTSPIVSACSYAGGDNEFQAEGLAFLQWRGAVWAHCYAVLADVQAGRRAVPTPEQLLAELPELVLP